MAEAPVPQGAEKIEYRVYSSTEQRSRDGKYHCIYARDHLAS